MNQPLKEQVTHALKVAMRAKDRPRMAALRLIQAEVKRVEIDERAELDDQRLLALLGRMVKQCTASSKQFRDAGRDRLADQELFEIEVIREFLPASLGEEELTPVIEQAILDSGAESLRDLGKVMSQLKPRLQGRADMGEVSRRVREKLGG